MATRERVFYSSENGDEWLLVYEGNMVAVVHRPNAASGGQSRTIELGAFMARERSTPQNQALQRLIATLTDPET